MHCTFKADALKSMVMFARKHFTLSFLHDMIKTCVIKSRLTYAELGQSSYRKLYLQQQANENGTSSELNRGSPSIVISRKREILL